MSSQDGNLHVVTLGSGLVEQFASLAKKRADDRGNEWCALVRGDMLNLQVVAVSDRSKMMEIAALPDLIRLAGMVMRGGSLSESFDLAENIFKKLEIAAPPRMLNEVGVIQDPADTEIFEAPAGDNTPLL